ncbi:MAG: roadblock/LC7 domain-containing protein [Chloroflexota bacterium]|nr:roadblock/LC7 domain-containing protein [Chloroflexota bacterium]
MSNEQREGPAVFKEILQSMNDQGDFKASVLAGSDGLPIATVTSAYDTDTTAAMVARLQKVTQEAQEQLGMAEIDEVTIFDDTRLRLVCRHFTVNGERLILAVMVPPYHYWRRLTNQAIQEIENRMGLSYVL